MISHPDSKQQPESTQWLAQLAPWFCQPVTQSSPIWVDPVRTEGLFLFLEIM